MKRYALILASLLLAVTSAFAQFNRIDNKGRRQGNWHDHYYNGQVRYEGRFKNDKCKGVFRYYDEQGNLKATNEFDKSGAKALNKTFAPNGRIIATGYYVDQKKDGEWKYYDADSGQLRLVEDNKDGKYFKEYDHSIRTIAATGVPTFFSELDISVLPNPYGFSGANVSDMFAYRPEMDPFKNGITKEKEAELGQFWVDFYKMLIPHRNDVLRVTFWCLNDGNSWRNDFPIKGRTDYATIFDRQSQPKTFIQEMINLVKPQCASPSLKKKGKK